MTKPSPFVYLNMINQGDKSEVIVDDSVYSQFLINRGLSLHLDTIAIVNELNQYPGMTNQMHFDYLRHMVTPRKRWAKWPKPVTHEDASTISTYFNISVRKAYDLIGIITPEDIQIMKEQLKITE